MTFLRLRRLRHVAAIAALLAYGLAPATSVLGGLSHGLGHLTEELRVQQERAAALGLVHSSATPAPAPDLAPPGPTVVHTHGGSTHAHGGVVASLLNVDDDPGDPRSEPAEAPVLLAFHVPANGTSRPPDLGAAPHDARPPALGDGVLPSAPHGPPPRA